MKLSIASPEFICVPVPPGTSSGIEADIIMLVSKRIMMGHEKYGAFVRNDSRDWLVEALEEAVDQAVYSVRGLLRLIDKAKEVDGFGRSVGGSEATVRDAGTKDEVHRGDTGPSGT